MWLCVSQFIYHWTASDVSREILNNIYNLMVYTHTDQPHTDLCIFVKPKLQNMS